MCEKCVHSLRDPRLKASCQLCFKWSKNWTVYNLLEQFLKETFSNQDKHIELLFKDLMMQKENIKQEDVQFLSLFKDYARLSYTSKRLYYARIKSLHEVQFGIPYSHARVMSIYQF